MSQNGQTHFKNPAAFAAKFCLSDHFGTLCIKGLKRFCKIMQKRFKLLEEIFFLRSSWTFLRLWSISSWECNKVVSEVKSQRSSN